MKRKRGLYIVPVAVSAALGLSSCFTGVESTPRISDEHVKAAHADRPITAEQELGSGLSPEPPSRWQPGKRFLVCDARVGRIFTPTEPESAERVGEVLTFSGSAPAITLTGADATDIIFSDKGGREHRYRLPSGFNNRLDTIARLDIPFMIDLALIEAADARLRNKRLYVLSPRWYDLTSERNSVSGLRYVEVIIDSVVAGTAHFPAAVCFTTTDKKQSAMMLINLGTVKANTRSFDKLFSFENPRRKYPEISEKSWEMITRSKVSKGMSREECRLALGQPDDILRTPSYGGMRERWLYTDGVYLIFDDGYLSRFRQ